MMLGGGFHRCQAASRRLKGAGSASCFSTILGPFFFRTSWQSVGT